MSYISISLPDSFMEIKCKKTQMDVLVNDHNHRKERR